MKNEYHINFNAISNHTISQLKTVLEKTEGIKVKDCSISDLVFYDGKPIYSGNGVYIFKYNDIFIYVGSCVARNFVERIPAHFDLRESGWFNSLLQRILDKQKKMRSNEALVEAGKFAMDNYSLIMINFPLGDHIQNISNIKALETLLRAVLEPYNTYKHKRKIDESRILNEYLTNTVLVPSVK
jgi:hypothetical protein